MNDSPPANDSQPSILQPVPAHARHLLFNRAAGADPRGGLAALCAIADGDAIVVGIGHTLVHALGAVIPGLRPFPSLAGAREPIPSTPAQFRARIQADIARWTPIIKAANIKVN